MRLQEKTALITGGKRYRARNGASIRRRRKTARELWPPRAAGHLVMLAGRIAKSVELSVVGARRLAAPEGRTLQGRLNTELP
jgi:hypothetical protein